MQKFQSAVRAPQGRGNALRRLGDKPRRQPVGYVVDRYQATGGVTPARFLERANAIRDRENHAENTIIGKKARQTARFWPEDNVFGRTVRSPPPGGLEILSLSQVKLPM